MYIHNLLYISDMYTALKNEYIILTTNLYFTWVDNFGIKNIYEFLTV